MPGRVDFDFSLGPSGRRREESEPMRLLVLGDLSGKPLTERPPLATRATHRVDVDNVDDVMRRIGPQLSPAAGDMTFQGIDDFHPDRLYARLDLFKGLREARANPSSGTDDLFGRLLGKPSEAGAPASAAAPASGLDALIHNAIAPHIVPDTSVRDQQYQSAVDATISEQMRALLHHPSFQSLEAAWRGVRWLISSLELDENLQLHLIDATRDELVADLVAAEGDLARTGLYRALVDRWRNVPGSDGWSALVWLMRFSPSVQDMGLLAASGMIASQAGGPLLAGADEALASDDGRAFAGWQALRRSQAARWIALAAPRVLLRLPYGKSSDPIESFAFEEIVGPPVHEDFLWGTGSLGTALLIGKAFTARGWEMEPGDEREIGDLPAYTFVRDGEPEMQACAERFLTESEIQSLLKTGLIPIASRRDRNGVVAIRFQSVSDPPAPLAW
jgi:type VI secretion system protein ImpC